MKKEDQPIDVQHLLALKTLESAPVDDGSGEKIEWNCMESLEHTRTHTHTHTFTHSHVLLYFHEHTVMTVDDTSH